MEKQKTEHACEKHKGNWHLDCPNCYANYCKWVDSWNLKFEKRY